MLLYARREGVVSEIVKDASPGPQDQIWERVPSYTEPWSEIVFLRIPQGRTLRGQRHGCQISHARHCERERAIGR
jgi:hypothetical protein